MKRNRLKIAAFAVLLSLLTACGGSGGMETEAGSPAEAQSEDMSFDTWSGVNDILYLDAIESAKLVKKASLTVETKDFDAAARSLREICFAAGGYFENEHVDSGYNRDLRYGEYTVRIPADKFDSFLSSSEETFHIVYREQSQEDIGMAYYDTEARLKSLQTQYDRLLDLLSRADKMEDIITIEQSLSEVLYQIEMNSGTLNRYDSLVNYATIQVYLRETEALTEIEEQGFISQLKTGVTTGGRNVAGALRTLCIGLAYALPTLIVLGIVGGCGWFGYRKISRRKQEKEENNTKDTDKKE